MQVLTWEDAAGIISTVSAKIYQATTDKTRYIRGLSSVFQLNHIFTLFRVNLSPPSLCQIRLE